MIVPRLQPLPQKGGVSPSPQKIRTKKISLAAIFTILTALIFNSIYSFHSKFKVEPLRVLISNSIPQYDHRAPEIAWLLSFPRSGSDYLIDIIHQATSHNTATNYGTIVEEPVSRVNTRDTYLSTPVYTNRLNGPYLFTRHLPLPTTFIPTVSYCTGYCFDCFPGRYAGIRRDRFLQGCLMGSHFEPSPLNNGENGFGHRRETQYDGDMVKKALLLVRNPFHIVEERFLYSSHTYAVDREWLPRFAITETGFYNYCREMGIRMAEEEGLHYPAPIFAAAQGILCHAEFYKVINWYNLVFEMFDVLEIPTKTVYYEDFVDTEKFSSSAQEMLDFYELTPVLNVATMDPPPLTGEGPLFFLTQEDKVKIRDFIAEVANPLTMDLLSRYLDKFIAVAVE